MSISKFSYRTSDPRPNIREVPDRTDLRLREQESWDYTAEESTFQDAVSDLTDRVETLVNQLGQFAQISNKLVKWTTQIRDLGDKNYRLIEPLLVLVEEYPADDVVIARLPELEVFGEGATDTEAILNLKESILDLYDELIETAPDFLGSKPRMWLRILRQVITKV